jgi:hypothetical protein
MFGNFNFVYVLNVVFEFEGFILSYNYLLFGLL